MKISYQSGRVSGGDNAAKHMDRTNRTDGQQANKNWYLQRDPVTDKLTHSQSPNFRRSIRQFYSRYEAGLAAQNERNIKGGHRSRCKSIGDLINGRTTRPEELIMQIGRQDDTVDMRTLAKCLREWVAWQDRWSHDHGDCLHVITVALHGDEATPHAHLLRVWDYDKDGNRAIGQEEALRRAGVPLPDPGKRENRYNNRKITFDDMAREQWRTICRAHGLAIDDRPPRKTDHIDHHKTTREYIRQQIAEAISRESREPATPEFIAAIEAAVKAEKQRKPRKSIDRIITDAVKRAYSPSDGHKAIKPIHDRGNR